MRALLIAACVLCASVVEAALPFNLPLQTTVDYNCNGSGGDTMNPASRKGAAALGVVWDGNIVTSGGFNNRGYLKFDWWDWDVSQLPNQSPDPTSVPAGYSGNVGDCETSFAETTYYAKFRIKTNAAILAHSVLAPPSGLPDGDTQMKWLIWGKDSGEGRDRVIFMLFAGNATANSGPCGGVEATQTCVALCAGVSASCAQTLYTNSQWVSVQLAWRWGDEGTAFQRIYINNNTEGSPTASNATFADVACTAHPTTYWCFPGNASLGGEILYGDIDNTGSAVRENADIWSSDFSLGTSFDASWYQSGTSNDGPTRIRRSGDLMLAAIGLVVPWQWVRKGRLRSLERRGREHGAQGADGVRSE
jgi:hypothetical protein